VVRLRLREMATARAFYVPDGTWFLPTEWTRGPWDEGAQHAGPPAALVGRAIESLGPEGFQVARFTLEVLRPIPLAPLQVQASVVRPGRRVQFAEAQLVTADMEVARASAWSIRASDPTLPEVARSRPPSTRSSVDFPAPFGPISATTSPSCATRSTPRSEPGPASMWIRMRVPLVDGEEPSPLGRVLAAADSGNGISNVLPLGRYLFINTELTVHLARPLEGEWVCLDAVTRVDPRGIGLAESTMWDERGLFGRGSQSLLVAPR